MIHSEAERQILEIISPSLEADGYKVVHEYSRGLLPENVKGYRPDAVAIGKSDFIAIEIKARRIPSVEKNLLKLKEDFEANPNWKFRLIYADDFFKREELPKVPEYLIKKQIDSAQRLAAEGEHLAGLIYCWASLEAIVRNKLPEIFMRPQTPGRIVTILAERGEITPAEAESLRSFANKRNAFVHGSFTSELNGDDICSFVGILNRLMVA